MKKPKMKAVKAWIAVDPHDLPQIDNIRDSRAAVRKLLKRGQDVGTFCPKARVARVRITEVFR